MSVEFLEQLNSTPIKSISGMSMVESKDVSNISILEPVTFENLATNSNSNSKVEINYYYFWISKPQPLSGIL
jgi:hypothetical protein|tara:strand:- start:339 stop:554 length:216 start_codon:yes stop_codon:yes gene_type:complete